VGSHILDSTAFLLTDQITAAQMWEVIVCKFTSKGAFAQTELRTKFLKSNCAQGCWAGADIGSKRNVVHVTSTCMSDIPLRSIRRNNSGYVPITRDPNDYSNSGRNRVMPAATRAAATSSTARRNLLRGKRKDRYTDNPEEATNLLGNDQLDEERYDDADADADVERRRVEAVTQVRSIVQITSAFILTAQVVFTTTT
jgi:hypothetical protein